MYTVTTTHQPSRTVNQQEFATYKAAFLFYSEKVNDCNIDEGAIEWPGEGQPDLCAGGRGHDYLIELTETN